MGRKISDKGIREEGKIEGQSLAERIIELADDLVGLNSKSLGEDYQDDSPRNRAIKGLDELRRGMYGHITERQDAQLVYILTQITQNENLDHHNDTLKQKERGIVSEIQKKAYKMLHIIRSVEVKDARANVDD